MSRQHTYAVFVTWVGNRGTGTSGYRDYGRDHEVTTGAAGAAGLAGAIGPTGADGTAGAAVPPPIAGSSDRAFRGDPSRWNPEQLLTAALSQCHMLAYLHLCATAGVVVTAYRDHAVAVMAEDGDGGGRFTEAVLRPHVTVSTVTEIEKARALHHDAHEKCFIANSVNFPVRHEPVVTAVDS